MRLVPYEKEKLGELKRGGHGKSDIFTILNEFANSDLNCVKIEEWTQKTANGCYTSIHRSISRYKMTGIKVVKRKDEVFLVKIIPE